MNNKTTTFNKLTLPTPSHVPPRASVICLHGLGADGHDLAGIAPELQLPVSMGVRFVFPHAPVRPVTLNAGMEMPAWFDLYSLDQGPEMMERQHDTEGLEAASQKLLVLMEEERALGVPVDRIVLMGFSQGGALALYTGMRYPGKLGGLVALSTYYPAAHIKHPPFSAEKLSTPIFMAHGLSDDVIPSAWGEQSRDQLLKLGFSVDWHTYPMAHMISREEIRDLSAWLQCYL